MFRTGRVHRRLFRSPPRQWDASDIVAVIVNTKPKSGSADYVHRALLAGATCTFFGTYCIIADWIYAGYVDLWHGVYGLGDDDDDDD